MAEQKTSYNKIGAVFLDEKKKTKNGHEYFSGVTEDGYWINAYINLTQSGVKYLNLVKGSKKEDQKETSSRKNDIDPDDLPF